MPDKMDDDIDAINKHAMAKREDDLRRRDERPELNLVVTRGGIPVEDQAQGIRDFKAACLASAAAGKSREREYPTEAENVAYEQGRADESMARADMHRECAQVLEMVSNRLRSLPSAAVETAHPSPAVPVGCAEISAALESAEQFIVNGMEFGFIRIPDREDSAHDTLPKIRAARAMLSASTSLAGWRDMSTAPKDGTWFLGWRDSSYEQDRIQVYRWYVAPLSIDSFWQNAADSNEADEPPEFWQPMLASPSLPQQD